jgi:hypothetical protein
MIHDRTHKPSTFRDGSESATLNQQAMDRIGRWLRQVYSQLEAEPADLQGLTRLLEKLAEKDAAR